MIRRVRYIGEPLVPLTDTYPLAVTFIVAPRSDKSGLTSLLPIGTGFVVGWPSDRFSGSSFHYVVTAKHVVESEDETCARFRSKSGGLKDLVVHEWFYHHKADVAVAPMTVNLHTDIWMRSVSAADFMNYPGSDDWEPVIGDRVYFIGLLDYFKGMVEKNMPMVRAGNIGALYQDDVPLKVDPVTFRYVRAHLIDCRSYSGFSGSPCFVQGEPRLLSPEPRKLRLQTPGRVLGLISGHFDMWGKTRMDGEPVDNLEAPINSGVGVVTPAEDILEVLMGDDLANERKRVEREHAKRKEEGATLDSSAASELSEFDQFENLARKLVQVPKKELDEKRKESDSA